MSDNYKVEWTQTAYRDLVGIIEYISIDSPSNAKKTFTQIKSKAMDLHKNPARGRIVPELMEQGLTQYRELVIPPWRLMYRVTPETVYIVSLIDSRRNVEDILLNRFTVKG